MREIKFRAWNKKTKLMSFSFGLGEDCCFPGLKILKPWKNQRQFIIMQYTGLEKNGFELYDGDIVRHCRTKSCWVIRWHNYKWGATNLQHKNTYQNLKAVSRWDSLEVVGNIYENKELL